ncbi:hypothetical protein BGZ91_010966 [Linnemannia elongata]|nr:hypothetical protein BGZ91_010966 [Linnemannia elongata]
MATNNNNDDNTSRYQCFIEMHPSGIRNSRHFQVPATIHPLHGPIVELELFHLWLGDTEDRPMDFFRGPRTRHLVDVYWDPPLGEFIRYHHNEVLYFYYSVITPEDGDTSDPYADRCQDPSDNHSTPSPPPISVGSTRSSSSSPIPLYAEKNKNTSPSLSPSKRATYRRRCRHRDPTRYLWKLVAYSGGLEAHLQNQRQQRQEKLKMVQLQQQRQAPLAVYMYDHGSSHQQQQSAQQQQHQSLQQPQQYHSPQNHQSQSQSLQQEQHLQPLNRAPILAQSFTHYGRRFSYHHQSHNQGYNQQQSPGYYHLSQAQNQHQQCSSYSQGQGQYYNQTHTSNTHGNHGQGHSPVQNYAYPVQSNNFNQTYNNQAPTNYFSQATNYAQTLNQLQEFNYQSPAGDRLVQEHLEECRWRAVKFETYLNDLHSKLGGRISTAPHPPPTIATVATQGRDILMVGDNRRSQGRGQGISESEQEEREDETEMKKGEEGKGKTEQKVEMENENEEEKKQEEREKEGEEALVRRGSQEFLNRKRSIDASNEEKEDEDKVEIQQMALSDDDRTALQRKPQDSSDTIRSIEDEAEKTEHKAKRSKKNTNNTSRGHTRENSPATGVIEPEVKRTRSRSSVSSMTQVSPTSGTMRYRR